MNSLYPRHSFSWTACHPYCHVCPKSPSGLKASSHGSWECWQVMPLSWFSKLPSKELSGQGVMAPLWKQLVSEEHSVQGINAQYSCLSLEWLWRTIPVPCVVDGGLCWDIKAQLFPALTPAFFTPLHLLVPREFPSKSSAPKFYLKSVSQVTWSETYFH